MNNFSLEKALRLEAEWVDLHLMDDVNEYARLRIKRMNGWTEREIRKQLPPWIVDLGDNCQWKESWVISLALRISGISIEHELKQDLEIVRIRADGKLVCEEVF